MAAEDLGGITDETKGVLLSLWAMGAREALLHGLDDEALSTCATAWRALARLEEGARHALLSAWRTQALSGLPDGITLLHPSWIEAALAGEPSHLLAVVRGSLPRPLEPVGEDLETVVSVGSTQPSPGVALHREIQVIALGHLAPLVESACGPRAAKLCALDFEALLDEVTRAGARTLGQSLAGADAGLRARAMALAGEPWAGVMAQAFEEDISAEQRRAAIRYASANVQASARTASERLLHVGLAAIAAVLSTEGPGSLLRVAGRLPESLGRQLLGSVSLAV